MRRHVAVLGAGAWGTALAIAAARAGCTVALRGRDPELIAEMAERRVNSARLPGVALDAAVEPVADLAAALDSVEAVLVAVQAQMLRTVLTDARPHLPPGVPIVICAKAIERGTGRFLSDVVREACPDHPPTALSGPSFASDVGRGLPTAVTVAADTLDAAAWLGAVLGSPMFRLYHTDDLRGVEIGGAAKNVLAIACGIAQGRGLGASAVAALTARAFAELARFGLALGGRIETLTGLSGLGDFVLTCGSAQSRNFAFGEEVGRSGHLPRGRDGAVVEGVWTAPVLVSLAEAHGVDMPVAGAVATVLEGSSDVEGAVRNLLGRPPRSEG